jgi:hypothetical protein
MASGGVKPERIINATRITREGRAEKNSAKR